MLGLGYQGGVEVIADPIKGADDGDGRFGGALEADGLGIGLEKIVPRIVLQDALEGGGCEFEVARIFPDSEGEGGVFEGFANLAHVTHAIAQARFMANEIEPFGVIDVAQFGAHVGEPRVL